MVKGYGLEGGDMRSVMGGWGWVTMVGWSGCVGYGGILESGLQHFLRQESCATRPVTRVLDDSPYLNPKTSRVVICDDFTCLTIRYHETDGSDAVND